MSTRVFSDPRPPITLADGVTPNARGKIYFYEPGAGNTTPKAAYANSGFTSELTNPVILNGSGMPSSGIYLNGNYRIVITTSADVTLVDEPNYQAPEVLDQFGDWLSYVTYDEGDFSRASNGLFYESRLGGNIGNDPAISPIYWKQAFVAPYDEWLSTYPYQNGNAVTRNGKAYTSLLSGENSGNDPASSPSAWVEAYYIEVWNQYKTFLTDDIVKFGDVLYSSLQDGNLGNNPSTETAFWKRSFTTSVSGTAEFSAVPSGISYAQLITHSLGTEDVYLILSASGSINDNFVISYSIPPSPFKKLKVFGSDAQTLNPTITTIPPSSGQVSIGVYNGHTIAQDIDISYMILTNV